ncbi:MAG: 50S ribosomal protein L10 [Candidatus Omnitrophica bacterium]|nr:50S ribosomal protein L10 [Candidatus Omnitrophota bacterium]
MAKIGKTCKEYMIKELSDKLKGKSDIFVTDCTGLAVNDLQKLRTSLKGLKVDYLVIKNSMGKLALKNVKMDTLETLIDGTIGLALGGADPISTSRTLVKFSKDTGKLKVKGGVVDGKMINDAEIKEIALLPSKEVLLARAFGGMKAPISGFVNVLEGTIRKFVYAINAIKAKKGGAN